MLSIYPKVTKVSSRHFKTMFIFYLCQFQSQGKTSVTAPPKPANKLDNMLGSLQSDLNKLGVQTVAKGVCGACKKPIAGQVMILTISHSSKHGCADVVL